MNIEKFDYSVNILRNLIWEYDDAPAMLSLLTAKQNWLITNQTQFWESWYTDVFNLQTANDFGLAVWSIILGLPLFIAPNPEPDDKPIWGFDDIGYQNYDNGTFANPSGGIVLTLEEKRLVLKLRYFQLITRGAIPEINEFLAFAFIDLGSIYALDGLDMTMVYVYLFSPSQDLLAALITYDLLPRPAGVLLHYIDATRETFGFDDSFYQNFDNGSFLE